MVKQNNYKKSLDKLILILATGMGIGYTPKAPGTAGSILAILIYLLFPSIQAFLVFTIILTAISFYIAGKAEKILGEKDCQKIVLDEIVGMSIALLFIPNQWLHIVIVFILFRLFDITKIFPAKKIEKLGGGIGVIGDDILAGVYTNIIIQIIIIIF